MAAREPDERRAAQRSAVNNVHAVVNAPGIERAAFPERSSLGEPMNKLQWLWLAPCQTRVARTSVLIAASVAVTMAFAGTAAAAPKKPKPVTLVAQAPVQLQEHFEPVGFDLTSTVFTVPDGKQLVIEFVSLSLSVPAGTSGLAFLSTTVGGTTARHFLPTSFQTVFNDGAAEIRTGATPTRIYADPGTNVVFDVHRNNGGNGEADVSVAGYLVDALAP